MPVTSKPQETLSTEVLVCDGGPAGVAAGTAAALAVRHKIAPRDVSIKDLQSILFKPK